MKFTEYKALELTKIAQEILQFWKDNDIFQKSLLFSMRDLLLPMGCLVSTM